MASTALDSMAWVRVEALGKIRHDMRLAWAGFGPV